MPTLICIRCHEEKEGLDAPPVGGALGDTIAGSVCRDCWAEWRDLSGKIINHYGLNLGDPHHREQLRRAMKEFLALDGGVSAESGGGA